MAVEIKNKQRIKEVLDLAQTSERCIAFGPNSPEGLDDPSTVGLAFRKTKETGVRVWQHVPAARLHEVVKFADGNVEVTVGAQWDAVVDFEHIRWHLRKNVWDMIKDVADRVSWVPLRDP